MSRVTLIFLVAITTVLVEAKLFENHHDSFSCRKQYFKFGKKDTLTRNNTFVILPGVKDYKLQVEFPLVKMPTKLVGMNIMICDSGTPRIQIYTMEPKHPKHSFVMIRRTGEADGEAFGVLECYFNSKHRSLLDKYF